MVRYLKYIVLIFGGIGLIAGSFFFLQNKTDILLAYKYSDKIDYDFLKRECKAKAGDTVYPCLKDQFSHFLKGASLTGTSMGLKMVFTAMDKDRDQYSKFKNKNVIDFIYALNFLEINNMAIDNVYKRYHGFDFLYGGFVSSLQQYMTKAQRFSQDIITGLEGPEGLVLVEDHAEYTQLKRRFDAVKESYYNVKKNAEHYIDTEWARLSEAHE